MVPKRSQKLRLLGVFCFRGATPLLQMSHFLLIRKSKNLHESAETDKVSTVNLVVYLGCNTFPPIKNKIIAYVYVRTLVP
ncbi:13886_t:CDS:2 [Ambispora leptoticha]|uniref:13886_t:CDS:1 n=1 Tax=Ambispora leptoticha TaxID=144679 RepID=A0A9N9B2Y4_9GLOM|nr:13886_t:CDS:2 [Ambispora leptoticha]